MHFILHHLQALCAFSHVPSQWDCMDLQPLPRLIFFNVDDSMVDCACCGDEAVTVCQCHCSRSILVGECGNRPPSIVFWVDDSKVGRCLLVAGCSVDRWFNFLVDFVGEQNSHLTLISAVSQPSWIQLTGERLGLGQPVPSDYGFRVGQSGTIQQVWVLTSVWVCAAV